MGWEGNMTIEIDQPLINLVNGMTTKFCRGYDVPENEIEDILGEAQLGLVRFVRMYDSTKGASLKTYLICRIKGLVKDCIRKGCGRKEHKKRPQFISINDLSIKEFRRLSANGIENKVIAKDLIAKILAQLPTKYASVLRQHYMHDVSQVEIARQLECTESNVSHIMKEARQLAAYEYRQI